MTLPASSLRSKIIGLSVALVVVPGVVLALIAIRRSRASLDTVVKQQLAEVAQTTAYRLVEILEGVRKTVRRQARDVLAHRTSATVAGTDISTQLSLIKEEESEYLDLLSVDSAGNVLASTDPRLVGKRVADEKWMNIALGGRRAITGPYESDRYGTRILYFSAPITDSDGEVAGVHTAIYDWRHTSDALESLRQTLTSVNLRVDLLVVTEEGRVMIALGRQETRELLGTDLPLSVLSLDDARKRAGVLQLGVPMLAGFARPTRFRSRWTVIAFRPAADAFAPVRSMQAQMLTASSVVLVLGVIVAWVLSSRIVRPLRELTLATRLLGESGGDGPSVAAPSRDEIGQLAKAFNQMGGDLKRARLELLASSRLAFAGEVAAGIAHEVRTPLSVMRGAAQILGRSIDKDKAGRELVDMIIVEVDRLNRVVGGLVEIAKPRNPKIEQTDLNALLQRAKDFLAHRADDQRISIVLDTDASLSEIRCDPDEIYQVVLNLTLNALQMLGEGGEIVLRTRAGDGGAAVLEVVDDGPGIESEVLEDIFTPFFTMRGGGTGLGLAMVQSIVESHLGVVSVTSSPGVGTTFRVELPFPE